ADLGDGVDIKSVLALQTPQDVSTIYGRLSGDAHFCLAVNGGSATAVTVTQASTASNSTVDDLVGDLNTALAAAGLGSQIVADKSGNRVLLKAVSGSVTAFTLTTTLNDAAASDMGFSTSQIAD